jgi:hypothetical protein
MLFMTSALEKVGRRDCLDLSTVRTARLKRDPLVICRYRV